MPGTLNLLAAPACEASREGADAPHSFRLKLLSLACCLAAVAFSLLAVFGAGDWTGESDAVAELRRIQQRMLKVSVLLQDIRAEKDLAHIKGQLKDLETGWAYWSKVSMTRYEQPLMPDFIHALQHLRRNLAAVGDRSPTGDADHRGLLGELRQSLQLLHPHVAVLIHWQADRERVARRQNGEPSRWLAGCGFAFGGLAGALMLLAAVADARVRKRRPSGQQHPSPGGEGGCHPGISAASV